MLSRMCRAGWPCEVIAAIGVLEGVRERLVSGQDTRLRRRASGTSICRNCAAASGRVEEFAYAGELLSRETGADNHQRAATPAVPCRNRWSGQCRLGRNAGEELSTKSQSCAAMTIRQETEMPDAHESLGQDMQEEAAQKLDGVKLHHA